MVEEWKRRQQRVEELAETLRELRIYSGQPERRLQLAGQLIAQAGEREVRREDLAALLLEAKEGQMARSPIGLVVSWLRDGSWRPAWRASLFRSAETVCSWLCCASADVYG